jgi:hypothetical protein
MFLGFLLRLVALPSFMRLSVKLTTGFADPREDETVLFGDLSLPQTYGCPISRSFFARCGIREPLSSLPVAENQPVERRGLPHLAKNERDMGHPFIRGRRTKNIRILFLLRKPQTRLCPEAA